MQAKSLNCLSLHVFICTFEARVTENHSLAKKFPSIFSYMFELEQTETVLIKFGVSEEIDYSD